MPEPLITTEVLRRLERLTLVSRRLAAGHRRGERRGRRRGASNDFADYRQYVTGDDLRFLDWKIYARLERLFLKLFLEEEDLRVHVLVDTSPSMDFGTPNKLHYAKQVAAALGYVCLCRQDNLNVRAFQDGLAAGFGPKRGKVNARAYFDFLDRLEPGGRTALQPALRQFAQTAGGRGVAVVISDFFDFGGYEEGLRLLFGGNLEVLVVHVLAPDELRPDLKGDLRLMDAEFGVGTDVSIGQRLLGQYQRTLGVFCDGLKNYVVTRGGAYVLTGSDLPFDRLVLDVLCRRGLLK